MFSCCFTFFLVLLFSFHFHLVQPILDCIYPKLLFLRQSFLLNIRVCTRLADMLPSKYEDNTLQIKERSTE
ncbi:hypothetical protein C4H55_10445, partial [Neisseria gonorrhoeae]